jgi:hypothetical protein
LLYQRILDESVFGPIFLYQTVVGQKIFGPKGTVPETSLRKRHL